MNITREDILTCLKDKLQPLQSVCAMWEGGAAANGRLDRWSDLDLQLDVEDQAVDDVVQVIEKVLEEDLSGIELRHIMPQPTWHGNWQGFYKLRQADPFLLIDLVIIKHSSPKKFAEPELHGQVVIHFDKRNVLSPQPLDADRFACKILARAQTLRVTFPLFQVLVKKEIHRGHSIEAVQYYHGFTLGPLIETLGILHRPFQYNFSTRYIYEDFPPGTIEQLEKLYFPVDLESLSSARDQAEALFLQSMQQIRPEAIRSALEAGR